MSRNSSMPTSRLMGVRNLVGILLIEVAFVLGLHWLGSMPKMQIDFNNFSQWLEITPANVALTASVRMVALVIAYWVLATSTIYVIARAFKIPGVLRAMEFATLPFVRKAIDGALAATIIGGTVFGGAGAVFAKSSNASKIAAPTSVTTVVKDTRVLYNPVAADDGAKVETPVSNDSGFENQTRVTPATPSETITQAPSGKGSGYVPVPAGDDNSDETPVNTTPKVPVAEDTTTTTLPKVVVPSTSRTPQPSESTPTTTTPKTTVPTTKPTPQPSTPTTTTPVSVDGERVQRPNDTPVPTTTTSSTSSYTVVDGDNFWNIAKSHLEKTLGRAPSNAEVANYWVKLIDANKGNYRSGDASLIYAGEVFTLPSA